MAVMEAIATTYLETVVSSVEFTSIPATYEHLQVRISGRSHRAPDVWPGGMEIIYVQFGTGGGAVATGAHYDRHYARGSGSYTPGSYGYAAATYISPARIMFPSNYATLYSPAVCDIYDYANTNKNTVCQFTSYTANPGSTEVGFGMGMWDATTTIDRIKFSMQSLHDWERGTTFSLYGLNSA